MITLTLKQPVEGVPLEAESICPDVMVTLDNAGVRALPFPGRTGSGSI